MRDETVAQLLELNQRFYDQYGAAFAATRRRVQPGIVRALQSLPSMHGHWLDLGCGSGALAQWWLQNQVAASYTGLDFSQALLKEALQVLSPSPTRAQFFQANLLDPAWPACLTQTEYKGILCFAVLHHLPGAANRLRLLQQVRGLLSNDGFFIHSVWQFQHSPKLLERVQPWHLAGIDEAELEPGDTLLDWRHTLPGQPTQPGLRYVHLFSEPELAQLADESGFHMENQFESDGKGGRLALYQIWRKQ